MLITDRTYSDVERAQTLISKVQSGATLTAAERQEYMGGLKGCYNMVSDWNRVEKAVRELSKSAGLALTTKTGWTYDSIASLPEVKRYLGNVARIRYAIADHIVLADYPLPTVEDWITYTGANQIESLLKKAYEVLKPTPVFEWRKYKVDSIGEIGVGTPKDVSGLPPDRVLYLGIRILPDMTLQVYNPIQNGKSLTAAEQQTEFDAAKQRGEICFFRHPTDGICRYEVLITTGPTFFRRYRYSNMTVNVSYVKGEYLANVTSVNANTYPDNGIADDGYWYEKVT